METCKVQSLLLIAFNSELGTCLKEELSLFCKISICNSMDELEHSTINYAAVIYLMDLTSADHLYNILFIRNKHPDKQFFVITSTVSIPLLHQSLHIGVNDLFIYPLSIQDKQSLLSSLKEQTGIDGFTDKIANKNGFDFSQISKTHSINSLLDIVERDYAKGPSLQDLANDINLSPSRICHLFKDLCGITYSYYLSCRKIEEGERLLTAGLHSITSISYQIGFANPSHFCRTFKEHFNITPTSYINGNREVEHSTTYLKYQRLRYELSSSMESAAEEKRVILADKSHVS